MEENRKIADNSSLRAKIWTKELPNVNQECYPLNHICLYCLTNIEFVALRPLHSHFPHQPLGAPLDTSELTNSLESSCRTMRTEARQKRDVGQENKAHATSQLATTTRDARILRLSNTDSHCSSATRPAGTDSK
jgi:hypothetical protein